MGNNCNRTRPFDDAKYITTYLKKKHLLYQVVVLMSFEQFLRAEQDPRVTALEPFLASAEEGEQYDLELAAALHYAKVEIDRINELLPLQKRQIYRESCMQLQKLIQQLGRTINNLTDVPEESRARYMNVIDEFKDSCKFVGGNASSSRR